MPPIAANWSHHPRMRHPLAQFTGMLALALAWLFAGTQGSVADIRYKSYAAKLMRSLPAGAVVRPDLEAQLDQLASGTRRKNGRGPLKASDVQRAGARAQAAEMILGNFVGHHTRAGFDFGDRFRAYMPDFEGLRGENAARDRRNAQNDAAKARRLFGQWLKSRRHNRNLNNPEYRYVSTGVIQVGNHLYATQIYWAPVRKRPANALFSN